MVLCDGLHQDPGTGKITLLGLCSGIAARDFPCVHSHLWVYVELTDGRGSTELKYVLVDSDEQREPIFVAQATVDFQDPRAVVYSMLRIGNITFPEPGEYRVQLFAHEQPLMERRILLMAPV